VCLRASRDAPVGFYPTARRAHIPLFTALARFDFGGQRIRIYPPSLAPLEGLDGLGVEDRWSPWACIKDGRGRSGEEAGGPWRRRRSSWLE